MAGSDRKRTVVDASFVLAFLMPDKLARTVDNLFDSYVKNEVVLIAPVLLPFEVVNGLRSAVLTKRITAREGQMLTEYFCKLEIQLTDISFMDIYEISLKQNISVYDAAYVDLAQQERVHLNTLDRKLARIVNA